MNNKKQGSSPEGFRYRTDIMLPVEEQDLAGKIRELPLQEFEFHGFTARRRVIYYGWQYNSSDSQLTQIEPIPTFLQELRERAAAFADLAWTDLALAQIIEYSPGAAIGWHRDRDVFGDIIGISLLSPCTFRLRRKVASTWQRYLLIVEPRSIYLLRGPSRSEWQHSIPAMDMLRYSIIFRSLHS